MFYYCRAIASCINLVILHNTIIGEPLLPPNSKTNVTYTRLPRFTRGIISICTLQTGDLFLVSGSEPTINVSGEAGHKIDCWLATARQEKIVSLKGLSGYNPPCKARETCTYKLYFSWVNITLLSTQYISTGTFH